MCALRRVSLDTAVNRINTLIFNYYYRGTFREKSLTSKSYFDLFYCELIITRFEMLHPLGL